MEGRGGEGKGGEGRGGEGRGGEGKERAMSPPTIWRKFTPMVPPLPPNPGYATALSLSVSSLPCTVAYLGGGGLCDAPPLV